MARRVRLCISDLSAVRARSIHGCDHIGLWWRHRASRAALLPERQTIYIDLDFFGLLEDRFGASTGEFAQAYVIAHEVAHHVQNELGIMSEMRSLQQQDPGTANSLSISLELQADCLAGVRANSTFAKGNVLEPGDIEDALSAASAVGDDNIQHSTQGRVSP